jgi:hypothetical protein
VEIFTQFCWPDEVASAKDALPAVGFLLVPLSYFVLVVLLLWAPKLRKNWMRIISRILGVAGLVSIIIALPAIVFRLALALGNPPTKSIQIRSPGGEEATLIYSAGFLGRDYTEVVLKHPKNCRHFTVFWHAGPSYFNDVKLDWADDYHLRLTYHTRPDDPQHCESTNGSVALICVPNPWPH